MTKKTNRQSVKDQIISQATSTVDELYAKRNALLAAEENTNEVNSQIKLTDQSNLTNHSELTIDNNDAQTKGILPVNIGNHNLPVNNDLSVELDQTNNQQKLTMQIDLTTDVVNPSSPVKQNLLSDSQFKLTDQNNLLDDKVNNGLLVNSDLSLNNQLQLTDQYDLTGNIIDSTSPVKQNLLHNDQFKLTDQNKLPIEIAQIVQTVGLSGTGALMLFQVITGTNGAYIRTRNLARDLGMTYQGLLNQLERLINAGYINSPPGDATLGRWVQITPKGQLNLTSQLYLTNNNCSCSYNNLTTTTKESDEIILTSQLDMTNTITADSREKDFSNSDQIGFSGLKKLTTLNSWEKAQLKSQAEELFYVAIAAKTEVTMFSMQTIYLYQQISKERGKDYAAGLFLILLPKARDNPTGYISSAFKQGAEPTSASITKIKELWETLGSLTKGLSSQEFKQQIQKATEKEDTEALLLLVQMQTKMKAALQLLSWQGTIETLAEKREEFITSLFSVLNGS